MEEVRDEVPLEFPTTLPPRSLLILVSFSHVAEISVPYMAKGSASWDRFTLRPKSHFEVKVSIFWALEMNKMGENCISWDLGCHNCIG